MKLARVAWLGLLLAVPATAGAATAWIEPPRVLSVHLIEREGTGDVIATFAAPLESAAPVPVYITLHRAGSQVPLAADRATLKGGWLTASWPSSMVSSGDEYDARLCPHGATCAAPVRFVAPAPWRTTVPTDSPAAPRTLAAPLVAGLLALLGLVLARRQRRRIFV